MNKETEHGATYTKITVSVQARVLVIVVILGWSIINFVVLVRVKALKAMAG